MGLVHAISQSAWWQLLLVVFRAGALPRETFSRGFCCLVVAGAGTLLAKVPERGFKAKVPIKKTNKQTANREVVLK